MDPKSQLGPRLSRLMAGEGQSLLALASTVLLVIGTIAYHRAHQRLGAGGKDMPQKSLDRIMRLQASPEAENLDPPLLQKHSHFEPYSTSFATYPFIRTFYHQPSQAERLPQSSEPVPLLVFIHGLGGSLAQFVPLLQSLINIAPCLGIDLPGNGLSKLDPRAWNAYSIDAMVALVAQAVDTCRALHGHGEVVLIGHSMGCSIAALLASTTSPALSTLEKVAGVIAICPKGTPPTKSQARYSRWILSMPDLLLTSLRWIDRRGGVDSPSVTRFVGEKAGPDLRRLQLRFNSSLATSAWKRMAWGCLPVYDEADEAQGGIPGRSVWAGIKVPLLLVAGQSDTVTKPEEVSRIVSFLQHDSMPNASEKSDGIAGYPDGDLSNDRVRFHPGNRPSTTESQSHHTTVFKTAILPAPASHALLYDPATHRTLAGLIEEFLSQHISHRLNIGWQLQQLATSGKWDVKNLKKWQGVTPVSEPIAGGIFRAMKTLREQDGEHTPTMFAKKWKSRIYAIIDISHDTPVYDPKLLAENGIQYHKFPTVSKIPPTLEDVRDFNVLVDRLRAEMYEGNMGVAEPRATLPAIAVHCHYGYNRTGFFITSYLIEKKVHHVEDAIEEFAQKRPPGIRHQHFIDTLFVRYCIGLKGTPALRCPG